MLALVIKLVPPAMFAAALGICIAAAVTTIPISHLGLAITVVTLVGLGTTSLWAAIRTAR